MQAVILSIGDELVLGQTLDTNSAYLSGELVQLGIGTLYHQTIADDQSAITTAIQLAASSVPLVLISGGIGPTEDDLTRQALAKAMGRELVLDPSSLEAIEAMFARHSRSMPQRNQVQAMHPEGTSMISNDCGTAPGIKAHLDKAVIYITPGVPNEMRAMFAKSILAELTELGPSQNIILSAKINTFGLGESGVTQKLGDLTDRQRNPLVGTTVGDGIVTVRVRSEFPGAQKARHELGQTVEQIEARLGPIVFGRDACTIQQSLVEMLDQRQLKVATAESCTGGLLGKMITDVPGASRVYNGGFIAYTNAMKIQLGVESDLLEQYGAVSESVAESLARNVAIQCDADLGVGITGIAGPDGGSAEKSVGTVCIGLALREKDHIRSDALLLNLFGDRRAVRDRAAKSAAQMLRLQLRGDSWDALAMGRTDVKDGINPDNDR